MSGDEHTVLICKPVAAPGYVVPGSLPTRCSQCGQGTWIAPSGMILLHDNPEMEVVCLVCGADMMREHPEPIEPPTPAQLVEIQEALEQRRN